MKGIDIPLSGYILVKQRCANCKKNLDRAHISSEGEVFCNLRCEQVLREKRKRASRRNM